VCHQQYSKGDYLVRGAHTLFFKNIAKALFDGVIQVLLLFKELAVPLFLL
jgi:hypothetical protein